MTRREFAAGAALLLPAVARAETQKERAKRIVEKTLAALGGKAFQTMQTKVETGSAFSFYEDEISGLDKARIETKYLAGEVKDSGGVLQYQRQIFGKKGEEQVLLSGTEAWDLTFRGAARLAQARVDQYRDSVLHDCLYILRQRVDEPGAGFDSHGADVIENQAVEALEFYDSENRSVKFWVDARTFLPARQLTKLWDPIIKDRRDYVTRYTKYRNVGGGVMLPFTTTRDRDGEKTFQIFATAVTINEPMPDSNFHLPAGIKIWKK